MIIKITTGIVVDKPTTGGNIYPRAVLESAIGRFNATLSKHPKQGGILDKKHIQRVEEVTHNVKSLFINDAGMLCAELELLDESPTAKAIASRLNDVSIVARPLLSVPVRIADGMQDGCTVDEIFTVMNVHLEYLDEHQRSDK